MKSIFIMAILAEVTQFKIYPNIAFICVNIQFYYMILAHDFYDNLA